MARPINTALIIDFDSTIVTVETLDELAKIVLADASDRDQRVAMIEQITAQGMAGEIDFATSLRQRFEIITPNKQHVNKLQKFLSEHISSSFATNGDFWRQNAESIWVVSGGFKEFIEPIVGRYGIGSDRIFANELVWDESGENMAGYNHDNFLSQADGKLQAVRSIGFAEDVKVVAIGDGMTDYAIREAGLADVFIAYVETADRPAVTAKADFVARDFGEVLEEVSKL